MADNSKSPIINRSPKSLDSNLQVSIQREREKREREGKMREVIELDDDDLQDAELISVLEAVEAETLASSAKSKRQRISSSSDQDVVELEGPYTAALRGSRSSLWQQQQQNKKPKNDSSAFISAAGGGGGDGGGCFKCGVVGHWARDCTVNNGEGSDRGGAVDEKPCPCGSGNCLVRTSNTAKNPGRKFYRCPLREENGGCSFFEWCDNPSSAVPTHGKASTEGKGSYGFSKLSNEPSFAPRQAAPFSVQTHGSYNNFSSTQSSIEKNYSSCFKCGQQGHWARDCTNSTSDSYSTKENNITSSESGSGKCFKCGKAGHWARDCVAQAWSTGAGDRKASHSFHTPFANKY